MLKNFSSNSPQKFIFVGTPLVMVVGTHQDGCDHGAGHHQHDRVEVRRCKVESGELERDRMGRGRGGRYNLKLAAIQTFNIC